MQLVINAPTLTSLEVAEMVGKEHKDLLRDIRTHINYLGESNFAQSDFFVESTYVNSQNKILPCYEVTKKGCELIAHKMTGAKGTLFSATYINRFHELEQQNGPKLPTTYKEALLALVAAEEEKEQLQLENNQNKQKIAVLSHVNKNYTATEIAKEVGLKSANVLNAILGKMKIQYQSNGTWVLYSKYADKGYVDLKQEVLDNGRVIYHRKWTQLGREFLLNLNLNEVY